MLLYISFLFVDSVQGFVFIFFFFFFFQPETAYGVRLSFVGSEMCRRVSSSSMSMTSPMSSGMILTVEQGPLSCSRESPDVGLAPSLPGAGSSKESEVAPEAVGSLIPVPGPTSLGDSFPRNHG